MITGNRGPSPVYEIFSRRHGDTEKKHSTPEPDRSETRAGSRSGGPDSLVRPHPTHNARGFTLIELMVVVAIVAILASIAYPSYVDHVRRARLTDAQMVLLEAAQWMERMNAIGDKDEDIISNQYPSATVFGTKSGLTRSPKEAKTNEDAFYLITNELEDKGYKLTATPRTGQQSRGCKSISIDNKGNRKANIDGDKTKEVMDCWK